MNLKQRSCFIPRLIAVWNLAEQRHQVTERALHLNLRSAHRGANRFRILLTLLDELQADPEFRDSPVTRIDLAPLRRWVTSSARLSTDSLRAAIAQTGSTLLGHALEWTLAVNRDVASLPAAPAFPEAAETLRSAPARLEIQVVSSANCAALRREWKQAGLLPLVHLLKGQEGGSKADILRTATRRFSPSRTLMVGDAPADHLAAASADVPFFPIRAGHEEADWSYLRQVILPRFTRDQEIGSILTPAIDSWKRSMQMMPAPFTQPQLT